MTLRTLADKEYPQWLEVVHTAPDPRVLQRAQAWLWLSAGEDASEGAQRLFVTPRTVSRWGTRFHQRLSLALSARLGAQLRRGRPRRAGGVIARRCAQVLEEAPRKRGAPSTGWT